MASSRRETQRLEDIVEAAESVIAFVYAVELSRFLNDDLLRSAVLHKLQVVGEAAAHVGPSIRASAPEVPWEAMVGFRNFTVHAYFAIDWETVYVTAIDDAPAIAVAVRQVLAKTSVPPGE